MKNEPFAKEPLLYISQPMIERPAAEMQHHYYTPKENNNIQHEDQSRIHHHDSTDIIQNENGPDHTENSLLTDREEDQNQLKTRDESTDKRLKFNEMTIKQKIDYFINKSRHIPQLNCLIRTKEQTYRGIITAYVDNEVHLQTRKRSSAVTKIEFGEIIDIKMVGF